MTENRPFSDADTVDAVGVLQAGGLDLVVSVTGPLDDSDSTLSELEKKLRNYVNAATSEQFLQHYNQRSGVPVVIYVSCPHSISNAALAVLQKMQKVAATRGVGFEIRKHMGETH